MKRFCLGTGDSESIRGNRIFKIDKIVVAAILVFIIVLAGEFIVYGSDVFKYDADAEWTEDGIDYSVYSSGSDTYSVILSDNGKFDAVSSLYIYLDETYDDYFEQADSVVDMDRIDQSYWIDQIEKKSKNARFEDVIVCNESELIGILNDTENSRSRGLLVISYALPQSVYTGSEEDLLLKWISSGGSMYWMGSQIGKFYTSPDSLKIVDNNQSLFFGIDCVNTGDTDLATSRIDSNVFAASLSLKNNSVKYGLNSESLTDSLAIGYCENGFSSITFVRHGDGMICVLGGDYTYALTDDFTQILAAGVAYCTEILIVETGEVERETLHHSIKINPNDCTNVYIYIGGYYAVYGESFRQEVSDGTA